MFKKAETAIQDIRYEDILDGYKLNVKSQVQSALTLVDYYYQQQLSGKLTESQAQEQAKEAVRALRYADDQGGYLWIDGTDYTLVMHPILREKEGSNRRDLEDCNGVMIIQEIMKAAEAGGGFNEFVFTKSDGVPRINAVLANTLNEIEAVSSQAAEIERGAESSAAASQEVTASSEELAALMNSIGNSTDTLNTEAEGLVEKLNAFTV